MSDAEVLEKAGYWRITQYVLEVPFLPSAAVVMSLHKLTAGDGYTYLTRQVAALDATDRGHAGLGNYYAQRGESPGTWAGSGLAGLTGVSAGRPVDETQMKALFGEGRHPDAERLEREVLAAGRTPEQARAAGSLGLPFLVYPTTGDGLRVRCAHEFVAANAARGLPRDAPLPAPERTRIRGEVARGMFTVEHGRPPADARELSGFIARASRPATKAVAGYDLTFSPVKSVSALWALAPREIAQQIGAAHHAAVADTLAWLERQAVFTRLGAGGVRQVETTGLIAAVFTHRDSRAGDPDLHTHVAVSNKVQTRDGRWRALDGRVLFKANVAASERYNTRLEAHLVAGLGVRFAERPGREAGKRPVREIVGVDARLLAAWSSRRQAIDVRRGELATDFQAEHGRTPTTPEAIALAQQATLETREAKHEPRSLAEQRAAWREQALEVLGGPTAVAGMLDDALRPRVDAVAVVADAWVRAAASRVLDTVAAQRATWQVWHVRAEAERCVRAADLPPDVVDAAVAEVTAAALSPPLSIPLREQDPAIEPPELRRSDGASVYTVAGAQLYTSAAVMDAEALLLDAAERGDGRRADPAVVELALLEAVANGRELNPGQAQLVRDLAGSGARLQLAIAPAGAGKTTALAALARAWTASGGSVLGLAPSAVATAGLREAIDAPCDTLAKLAWTLTTTGPDAAVLPDWVADIGPGTLAIVDEAGMTGTLELASAVSYVLGRGGSVRLIGDDRQLASVAAGGVLAEMAATHGAVTLTQLVRFADQAEAAATVALRDGDTTALGFYLDADRVHVGDAATCAEHAYQAWLADRSRSVEALLLAATRETVLALNARARADRLASLDHPVGPEVVLTDGTRASVGDAVITRRNDRSLPLGAADWVKNGDRWTVTTVGDDGSLTLAQTATGRRITLPAAYVRDHVQLGYATTVHGAQGATADTCHTVLTGGEPRQLLYVALSRGRTANHLYLATVGDGDPHSIITPAAVFPPTATDLLTDMLARDGAQTSATGARRALINPAEQLHSAAARYADALRFAAGHHLGHSTGEELENAAERLCPGLTAAAAWPTLRGSLALLAVGGTDPIPALTAALEARELGSAGDLAAVLDWRLNLTGPPGPLPWLPGVPTALTESPHWGPYLAARADHVTACAARVADTAAAETPATAPAWARPLLNPDHDSLRADLAVWRAAHGIPDSDRRPTGPPRPAAAERRHQAHLNHAVAAAGPPRPGSVWTALADSIDPRIRRDAHWPALAERLAAAARAGLDAAGLLAAVAAQRPLPDDLPAAALWWRLSPHLTPATVPAARSDAAAVRPDWCTTLLDLLPAGHAQRVLVDPAWPALVAAITTGIQAGWSAADLLTAATAGLPEAVTADRAGRGVAEALVFRVAALTDPVPIEAAEPLPADLQPPDDAHLLPTTVDDVALAVDVADLPPADEEPLRFEDEPPAEPRYLTPDPFALGEPAGDDADYLLDQHFWATAAVGRDRLIELNTQAAAFYTEHYPTSWAPGYLRQRLGTDLAGDPRFTPGYAPAGWTALVDHLRGLGATDVELLATGLAQRARTGALIDRFRDRLTLPIHDADGAIRGFIARRNPSTGEDGRAGPKYLNTPGTDLYRKGEHLLGLHENRAALAAGATPALVEGPMDAIALTLAGNGATVGIATLGTALTDQQADLLCPYIRTDGPGILVATDNDPPGHQAAERMFWQLTTRGDDPRRLALPDGLDPADLFHRDGATTLRTAIDTSPSLAGALLDARVTPALRERSDSDIHAALREVGAIIVALPPSRWLAHIDRVTEALGVPPGTVHKAVLDTEPITTPRRRTTTGPHQLSRLAPLSENHHRTGHTGQPPHGAPPDLHFSR